MEKEDNLKEETLRDDMFIGFNEKGEKKTFYKLLEFDSKDGVHYLAYTDNETDEKGNLKAYGSILQKDEEKGLMKLKPITNEKEWPKFLRVNDFLKNVSWNKHLLKPWEKGELVKVLPISEQIPSTNMSVEHFRRKFVKVIRKDENGQWTLRYTWSWEIFEPLNNFSY